MNRCFVAAIAKVSEIKGENWMCRSLRNIFTYMHRHPAQFTTRMVSIEVWDERDVMVASEVGYCVGSIYTSLSGVTLVSGAGSVQLAVLGCTLKACGFTHWDFGMEMQYKVDLGGVNHPRAEWVSFVRANVEANSGSGAPVLALEQASVPCLTLLQKADPPGEMHIDANAAEDNEVCVFFLKNTSFFFFFFFFFFFWRKIRGNDKKTGSVAESSSPLFVCTINFTLFSSACNNDSAH